MQARIGTVGITTLVLAAAATACQPQAAPSTDSVGWIAYKNEPSGFALEIPAGWAVEETIQMGSTHVAFGPPGGGPAIVVQVPASANVGTSDLPNVRCQAIEVGGLPAVRCRDTVSGGDVTSIAAPGRTYEIANLGKRSGDVYEHVLASFVLLVPG